MHLADVLAFNEFCQFDFDLHKQYFYHKIHDIRTVDIEGNSVTASPIQKDFKDKVGMIC